MQKGRLPAWIPWALLAALAGGLSLAGACSRLKMVLPLAPWYAEQQILQILPPLTTPQHERLKLDLKNYWRWNKSTMMPAYARVLRGAADSVAEGAAAKPLLTAPFIELYAQSIEPLIKPATVLLLSLDTRQIDGLQRHFQERQAEARQRYLADPEATLQRRVKSLRTTLEYFAGPLNPAQQQRLLELSRQFPIPYQAWLTDRARREAQLLTALREKRSEADVQALLRAWWLRSRTGDGDREEWQWDDAALQKQAQDLVFLLEPAQRVRAQGKLMELAAQLEALARDPDAAPRPAAGGT